jgi:hypothetical protein
MADTDTEGAGQSAGPGLAARMGKWITLISAAATVVLTGWNAQTASRMQEAELRQRDQQLAIESSRERVARYQFVSGLTPDLFSADPQQQLVTVNIVRLTLTPDEADVFFKGLLASSDSTVREAGALGVESAQRQLVAGLVQAINAPTAAVRRANMQRLYDDASDSPYAVELVLDLLTGDGVQELSASGRINALYFLNRAQAEAWTTPLIRRAEDAIRLLRRRDAEGVTAMGEQTAGQVDALEARLQELQSP